MNRRIYLEDNGLKFFDLCKDRPYFLIGRHPDNDLTVLNRGISRFHATIFDYDDSLWLIDHSQNFTFYNPLEKSFQEDNKLENSTASQSFIGFKSGYHKIDSRRELFKSQNRGEVQRIPDFVPGKFAKPEDIHYILEMISSKEQVGLLCSCARRLKDRGFIGLPLLAENGHLKGLKILEILLK